MRPAHTIEYVTATATCEKVLRALLVGLDSWGNSLLLVGGLLPRYIIPMLAEGAEPHLGTTDLDVVLTLTLGAPDPAPYRSLEECLADLNFAPAPPTGDDVGSFRWMKTVDGLPVKLEFLAPPEVSAEHMKVRPIRGGGAIGALRVRGAELVARDWFVHELEGPVIDGATHRVPLRVAGLVSFLVLKSFALNERRRRKDAYDVVWTLTSAPAGVAAAAERARMGPVSGERIVAEAFAHVRHHFSTHESDGSHQYADFLAPRMTREHAILQRFASRTVREFLSEWDKPRAPVPAL